jgi:hypothetical protein
MSPSTGTMTEELGLTGTVAGSDSISVAYRTFLCYLSQSRNRHTQGRLQVAKW